VWCESENTKSVDRKVIIERTCPSRVMYMRSPPLLSFWLFHQERGGTEPWSLLITDWREAKPCVGAMHCAQTGDTRELRVDHKRPALKHMSRPELMEDGEVCIAVRYMVIMCKPSELAAAQAYAIKASELLRSVTVDVVADLEEFEKLLIQRQEEYRNRPSPPLVKVWCTSPEEELCDQQLRRLVSCPQESTK